jgi:hypothetical protein
MRDGDQSKLTEFGLVQDLAVVAAFACADAQRSHWR